MSGNASAFTHKRTSPMSELPDRKALTTQVDRLLLQQGRLDPLELLLALELLPYEDYQAWRLGRRASSPLSVILWVDCVSEFRLRPMSSECRWMALVSMRFASQVFFCRTWATWSKRCRFHTTSGRCSKRS